MTHSVQHVAVEAGRSLGAPPTLPTVLVVTVFLAGNVLVTQMLIIHRPAVTVTPAL